MDYKKAVDLIDHNLLMCKLPEKLWNQSLYLKLDS